MLRTRNIMFTVGVVSEHQSPGLIYTFTALQVKGVVLSLYEGYYYYYYYYYCYYHCYIILYNL